MISEWINNAACYGKGNELFFSDSTFKIINRKMIVQAKVICKTCPVASDCLTYAINKDERFGIWGGYSSKELMALKRYFAIEKITKEEASVLVNRTVLDVKSNFKNTLFNRRDNE